MLIPEIETQPLEVIQRYQEGRLQDTLAYLAARSPYYKRMFEEYRIRPEKIRTLYDLLYIPLSWNREFLIYNK